MTQKLQGPHQRGEIHKRKQESKKKERKQELDQESDEEKKRFFFLLSLSCFLTFLFSFINSHLSAWREHVFDCL